MYAEHSIAIIVVVSIALRNICTDLLTYELITTLLEAVTALSFAEEGFPQLLCWSWRSAVLVAMDPQPLLVDDIVVGMSAWAGTILSLLLDYRATAPLPDNSRFFWAHKSCELLVSAGVLIVPLLYQMNWLPRGLDTTFDPLLLP